MKIGSSKGFYKWADDVKKAFRHKRELEDKLKYYERLINHYQAISYDSVRVSSSRSNVEDKLLFYLGKIEKINSSIKKADDIIRNYYEIRSKAGDKGSRYLELFIEKGLSVNLISKLDSVNKQGIYNAFKDIFRNISDL